MAAYFRRNSRLDQQSTGDEDVRREVGAISSVRPLAVYGRFRVMDGSPIKGAVILAFPTFEEVEVWYNSPAYQDAVQHRLLGAKYQTFIIQGA
jgi:uncharacterized protein (DUF1330 family)